MERLGVTRMNLFDFDEDPNADPDMRILIFFKVTSPLREGTKNDISHNISKRCGGVMTKLGGLVG